MRTIKNKKFVFLQKNKFNNNGFGLVDAILSLSLLAGIITYGVYFSSLRLTTVHSSNLIRSVNKEIERDIERLKLDLWSLFYNQNEGDYELSDVECSDLAANIINLPSWNTQSNTSGEISQSWRPGEERSKVFSGNKVLITRELSISSPIDNESLNNSIGTLNYRVEWGLENKHWLSIDLGAEAHSWCKQII
tara:strand:- start:21 stop:596 length:576 start_codon:yes stop_codon:yes gene_type:complete